ncbi:MAG: glycosyltransferase family 2 protein [Dermatophilus congolensis]|nr:glycosyltransferase family 2 protein [Dermatophilus congolensis]
MSIALEVVLAAFGLLNLIAWAVLLSFLPLAVAFEVRERHRLRRGKLGLFVEEPLVSIVVPGYNEGKVIEAAVRSILANPYRNIEVILVDDGSTDNTADLMEALAAEDPRASAIRKPNGGKGSALNTGFAASSGEIVMFVDSDGVFTEASITAALVAFSHPRIGAVCGDDRPSNVDRPLTRFLAFIAHVGTGLVRRAFSLLGCMPVVSGNNGAFRRSVLEEVGGLRTDTLGEDLELTWRIHRAGYGVAFAPRAIVYAETPSTLRGLWKQRVRWARGLLQSLGHHAGAIGNLRYGTFGAYLLFCVTTMVLLPVFQAGALVVAAVSASTGRRWVTPDAVGVLIASGLALSLLLSVVAILLDGAPKDLRHAWTTPFWPVYALLMSLTMVKAVWLIARRTPSAWNKLERTGVITVDYGTAKNEAHDGDGGGAHGPVHARVGVGV